MIIRHVDSQGLGIGFLVWSLGSANRTKHAPLHKRIPDSLADTPKRWLLSPKIVISRPIATEPSAPRHWARHEPQLNI